MRIKQATIKKEAKKKNDLEFAIIAANAAEEKKGEDVLLLDVSKLTIVGDYFLIITAKSPAQIEAIAEYITEELNNLNYKLISKEGFALSNWMVLDFGNIVVHIMSKKIREYYKLERFWSNATFIEKKLWRKAS
ncbi:MAG: ribosome silencing factor [Candidatus Melainabacteria bacterium]|nr:ribosome silencing factor [Candidatus Melainabacteria bacterium]